MPRCAYAAVPAPTPPFRQISGRCKNMITSAEECISAVTALQAREGPLYLNLNLKPGIRDSFQLDLQGVRYDPPGCYVENGVAKFNPLPAGGKGEDISRFAGRGAGQFGFLTNMGRCSTSDVCVCRGLSATTAAPPTLRFRDQCELCCALASSAAWAWRSIAIFSRQRLSAARILGHAIP